MNVFKKAALTFILKTVFGIKKVRIFLQGKKSYLIGAGIIIDAIVKWLEPNPDTTALVVQILIGVGFFTIRAAIANGKKKTDANG